MEKVKFEKLAKNKLYLLSQVAAVLCVCLFSPFSVRAGSDDVTNKVSSDILKRASFNQTSEIIANRPAVDFTTIGADANCDVNSGLSGIQDVIDTGIPEIRVASNGTYFNNLTIDNQSVVIRGGFADCTAAENNNQTISDLTLISGSFIAAPVIRIMGIGLKERQVVRLENLELSDGTSLDGAIGGGLSLVETELELQMLRVLVNNNSGAWGAGMNVDNGIGSGSADIDVYAQDVLIAENDANFFAGGINCAGGADVTFTGMSLVINNTAATSSGGISMRNGCEISFYSEFLTGSLVPFTGIVGNRSDDEAGGVKIRLGASLFLFGQKMCVENQCLGSNAQPIVITANHADNDSDNDGDGGGLYMEESNFLTEVYANGVIIEDNRSGGNGGGAYIGRNAKLTIERQKGGCWTQDRCNLIIDNSSGDSTGFGGGFYVADEGQLEISHSYVEENRADFGTAISASGESAVVTIENSVFDDNGDEGSDGFSDFNVIDASLGASIAVRHSTFAANHATNTTFNIDPALDSSMTLFSSIVFDTNSGDLFGAASGPLMVDCLVAHEDASYSGTNVVVDSPSFVNPDAGDFHLASSSPAIDLCQGIPMLHPLDMDNEPRGWDDPENSNGIGFNHDAGADESYINDVIFKDGFEPILAM